jgi:hypothetical protein
LQLGYCLRSYLSNQRYKSINRTSAAAVGASTSLLGAGSLLGRLLAVCASEEKSKAVNGNRIQPLSTLAKVLFSLCNIYLSISNAHINDNRTSLHFLSSMEAVHVA